MNMFDLSGKVAVVFGGTSGIGKSISHGLSGAGATVVAIGRDRGRVERMMAELGSSLCVTADVTKRTEVEDAYRAVLGSHGKVDILVNSAGAHLKKPTLDVSEEEWDRILGTNLKGTLFTCQVFGKHMVERRDGRIINIASLGAHVALSEAAAYCASKAGVLLLTKCLAVEWAPYGVRVNAISPGVFRTDLNQKALAIPERLAKILSSTPMARLGHTDELAGAAVYLASDASGFVTGESLAVDGGFLASGI